MTRIRFEALTVQLDAKPVLKDVSGVLCAGSVVAIVGPNGAGKSTLLRAFAGLLPLHSGTVLADGEAVAEMPSLQRARKIGYLAPDGRAAWPMSVSQIVALGRLPHLKPLSRLTAADHDAVETAMERAGILAFAERRFDTLSSGEKARVLLARALAGQADILLLDEPTAALDPKHQLAVLDLVRAEAKRGALVVLSIHALELAASYADRVIVLNEGRIHADDRPEQALSQDVIRAVFGVQAPGGIAPTPLVLSPSD